LGEHIGSQAEVEPDGAVALALHFPPDPPADAVAPAVAEPSRRGVPIGVNARDDLGEQAIHARSELRHVG
jgi:hypothetical protein